MKYLNFGALTNVQTTALKTAAVQIDVQASGVLLKVACIRSGCGFTVIELLVVLAALTLLLSVATPRYLQHLDTAREVTLKEDLHQLRDAIDKFYSDQARYPKDLEELVVKRYLRALPEDPMTQRVDSWVLIAPPSSLPGAVYEVRSGAKGLARDGSRYETW